MKFLHCRPCRWFAAFAILLLAGCGSAAVVAKSVTTPKATAAETPVLTTGNRLPPIIHQPVGGSSRPKPLLIVLQGSGGSPSLMEQLTHFDRIANEHGFVVAYLATLDQKHPWKSPADLPYVSNMIDRLVAAGGIDASRIYVTGFSAGGKGTWGAACQLSQKVAAVAIVEGGMPVRLESSCRLSRPVSELLIIGTADYHFYPGVPGKLTTPDQSAATWRLLNGCSSQPPKTATVATVTQWRWDSCTNGTSVGLDVIQGGGHTWPAVGGSPGAPLYDASEAVWSFVSAHRLSPVKVGARLLSFRVSTVHKKRTAVTKFRLSETLTGTEILRQGRRTVATKQFRFRQSGDVSVSWVLPRKAAKGRYTVAVSLGDAYGRTLNLTRTIRLR